MRAWERAKLPAVMTVALTQVVLTRAVLVMAPLVPMVPLAPAARSGAMVPLAAAEGEAAVVAAVVVVVMAAAVMTAAVPLAPAVRADGDANALTAKNCAC